MFSVGEVSLSGLISFTEKGNMLEISLSLVDKILIRKFLLRFRPEFSIRPFSFL